MDSKMTDFTRQRITMVDTQIRPSDVTSHSVIGAMLEVPREAFVPPDMREIAYAGAELPLGGGRAMLEPRSLAKLLDGLAIRPAEMVLHVGCGLGYGTALLARMAEFVVALEEDEALAGEAESLLAEHGVDNVAVVRGPLREGVARHAPYDAILIEGAIEELPGALADQLREGGRIATILSEGGTTAARIGHKSNGRIFWRFLFDAAAPVLPGFAVEPAFAL